MAEPIVPIEETAMQVLVNAGLHGDEWNKFGDEVCALVNTWAPFIEAVNAEISKPLDTLSDEDILAHMGGQPLSPAQYDAMRKNFNAAHIFSKIEEVKNELPANTKV